MQFIIEDLATRDQSVLDSTEAGIGCIAYSDTHPSVPLGGPVVAIGVGVDAHFTASAPHAVAVWSRSGGDAWSNPLCLVFDRTASMPIQAIGFSANGRFVAAVGQSGSGGLRGEWWPTTTVGVCDGVLD